MDCQNILHFKLNSFFTQHKPLQYQQDTNMALLLLYYIYITLD